MVSALLGGAGGAIIGTGVLRLRTERGKYKKDLKAAEGEARTFGRRSAVAVAAGAVGFTVLAGAAVASIRSFAAAGDEVQKMGQRTGFSTEALSELRHAAELSGSSLEGFETSVRRMQRTVFDAGRGLKEAEDALAELGLTVADLERLSPEQQFDRMAAGLAAVEGDSRRAALAQVVFGRAGTSLLPMLSQGAEGLAAMRQEARDLGIVFDQEAADKAAQFNDDLTRLSASLQALGFEAAQAALPLVSGVVTGVTAALGAIRELPGPVQQATLGFATMATTAPAIAVALTRIGPAALSAAAGIRAINLAVLASPIGLAAMGAALLITVGLFKIFGDAADEATEAQERQARATAIAGELTRQEISSKIIALEKDREALETQDRTARAVIKTTGIFEDAHIDARKALADAAQEIQRVDSELADLDAANQVARESAQQLKDVEDDVAAAMATAAEQAEEQADALREVTAAALAASIAADILGRDLSEGDFEQAIRAGIAQVQPLVEQEGAIADLVELMLRGFNSTADAADDAGDGLEEFSGSVSDASEDVDGAAERMRDLEEATRALVEAERSRAQELHGRAVSNAQALARAAMQGANAGIDVSNIAAALDEQNALAAGAASRLQTLNPGDPSFASTQSLTVYGDFVDQRNTKDMPNTGPDVDDLR